MKINQIVRIALYGLVAVLAFVAFQKWMVDYPSTKNTPSETAPVADKRAPSEPSNYSPGTFNPGVQKQPEIASKKPENAEAPSAQFISVKTDVLDIKIDESNGNIISAHLLQYPVSEQEKNTPIQILSPEPNHVYTIQTNLTGQSVQYTAQQKEYQLSPHQETLSVQLTGKTKDGLEVVKTYYFTRGKYKIDLSYQVTNTGSKDWAGSLFAQILRREPPQISHHFFGANAAGYQGAAISSPKIPYKKIDYSLLNKGDINQNIQGGWIAMQQHYFLVAAIPQANQMNHYYSQVLTNPTGPPNNYVVGFVSSQMVILPGKTGQSRATFYVGPETAKSLKTLAPGLERTIDYGWLWPISVLLFGVMSLIQKVVRNWGFTIIFTTIAIKIVFYWFSATSFRSMARMREMQPRIQALKERYGDDRQAVSKATMELYRKEKINPLGGCLPMIIQIPVFIAFYYVIIESVQLRQAPFLFWIHDLSSKDPYYILPILMGLSMLLQQFLSPTAVDPTQKKMMWLLPIIFTAFFISFPAGLVLYWITNNLVQTLQQWYVNKTYESHKAKKAARRERKKRK
jgi:YidC/Oxa1 family membrane protein insertase